MRCGSSCPEFDGFCPNVKGDKMVEAAGIEPEAEQLSKPLLQKEIRRKVFSALGVAGSRELS